VAAVTHPALSVHDLRVTFPGGRRREAVEAVRGASFEVAPGECVAVLGPNGAGKTTTLEVCEGLRRRTSGAVSVLGHDPGVAEQAVALRRKIGVVLQDVAVWQALTVREAVLRQSQWFPRPRQPDEVICLVGLEAKADARVGTLSGGQRRRLDVALGVVGRPQLLFLDEPTTGFDPAARREAWDLVARLRTEGATVVLTTHYLEEAQTLADRLVVMSHGQVVASGTATELAGARAGVEVVRFSVDAEVTGLPALRGDDLVATPADGGTLVEITTPDVTRALHTATGWALQRGLRLHGLTVVRPTLEDAYLALIGASA
jgi:ABC-2 type transport system ATP-binding protein